MVIHFLSVAQFLLLQSLTQWYQLILVPHRRVVHILNVGASTALHLVLAFKNTLVLLQTVVQSVLSTQNVLVICLVCEKNAVILALVRVELEHFVVLLTILQFALAQKDTQETRLQTVILSLLHVRTF